MIPKNVDCIIIGTGLTNSILAAACSRIGKSVLHVDKNNYYGDSWASFTFLQLIDWIKDNQSADISIPEELISKSRMFCIDLCPRLLYSDGAMVELLVKSNVSRYHEFKNNIRILSIVDDEIHVMPCRRNDVFTSPLISDLIDKRKLMRFIEICLEPEAGEIAKHANKPIVEFLTERGLNYQLREHIINSIAMVQPTDTTEEACRNIKKFMVATEKYGRSPFLFPLYGCGEFPQSFCRLSAVFGGVYCLNTRVESVKKTENFVVKLSNNEHEVTCDNLIVDHSSALDLEFTKTTNLEDQLSRAILITRKSIVPNSENLISFLRIPPSKTNDNLIYFLEFNSSVMVCPPDLNIVYLWTKSSSTSAELDLSSTIERIYGDETTQILWKFYYKQLSGLNNGIIEANYPDGVHVTSSPVDDIDYSHSIDEAKQIFLKMFPDQEFLPRAPDPDEIIP